MGMMIISIVASNVKTPAEVIIPRITWPALMFADNRKDRVIGRMEDLNDSTIDRNLAIKVGLFSGSKWAYVSFNLFVIEMVIMVSHEGAPILIVVMRWEVMVTVNGEAPQIFITMIEVNVGVSTIIVPFRNRVFVDLVNMDVIFMIGVSVICRDDGVSQYSCRNRIAGRVP